MEIEMEEILQLVQDRSASDLHLKVGQPPVLRVAGKLLRSQLASLTAADVERLVYAMLKPEQRTQLETN
jgi:twitching motility protein PilT